MTTFKPISVFGSQSVSVFTSIGVGAVRWKVFINWETAFLVSLNQHHHQYVVTVLIGRGFVRKLCESMKEGGGKICLNKWVLWSSPLA